MKRYVSILLLFSILFSFIGCADISQYKLVKTKTPINEVLSIKGKWQILSYKVLSDNVVSKDKLNPLIGSTIDISEKYIKISEEIYNAPSYKLKVVNNDYVISYESNYTVKELNLNKESIEVISVINKNNIVMEFFRGDNGTGFIFYNGLLLEVKLIGEAVENDDNINENQENKLQFSNSSSEYNSPVGLYLGIKSKDESEEKYRTIFISLKNGDIKYLEKDNEIIMPRISGIWSIKKAISEIKGYKHEHFEANPIDLKQNYSKDTKNNTELQVNTDTYRSIKYIGNDYISTEVYYGKNFKGEYNKYEVIPIDNIKSELPVKISDIFLAEGSNVFKSQHEKVITNMTKSEIENYSTYIDYNNFALERRNGKWNIVAKISPILNLNGPGYDYFINLKPNKKLINYDLLSIPWKTLKRKIPLLEDAYISPNNRIAIVTTNDKILIYEIQNGTIKDSPTKTIPFNSKDQIIMAEWCTGDYYVNMWGKPFLE